MSAACAGLVCSARPGKGSARRGKNDLDRPEPIAGDPQRPGYHFLPPRNWMNDPNGLIQLRGEYHLFYQHNPRGPRWGNMSWGHAKSPDLVHWEHLPLALRPDMPYDGGGVFSGCMVNDNGTATAIYTGVSGPLYSNQVQCIAFALSSDMINWGKYEGNPVIASPPPGVASADFRDPYVWRHGDEWLMAVGASMHGRDGAVILYRSQDLRKWDYLGPLYVGSGARHGRMFECPCFFPMGDMWVLIISPMRGRSNYFTGKFSDYRFEPERYEELDRGGCLYAPQVFRDDGGRRIMFGWLKENRLLAARHGWQGVQSLPRVLSLDENNSLNFAPCQEVESLRGDKKEFRDLSVKPGDSDLLADLTGDCLDVACHVDMKSAGGFGLVVRRSPDGREQTRIVFDRVSRTLSVDRSRSSISIFPRKTTRSTAFKLGASEPLDLRVLLDRSVIEVFANRRTCLTSRIYPKRFDSLGLDLLALGGEAVVNSLDVWQISPLWR